jgi:glycosyltransferase involved in cell wall biosynthesis
MNSVLTQSFSNFELIIIDDCSNDNTVEIIEQFTDLRIKLIQTSKNAGPAAARNMGIQLAQGSIICFLDSDDFYEPEMLLNAWELLFTSNDYIGFMWTGLRMIRSSFVTTECWNPALRKNNYLTFLHSLHIGTNSGIAVKKNVFEKCGFFDERLPAAEDTDFFLRITQQFGFVFTPKILINIDKTGEDRLSKDYSKIAKAYNLFLPKHFNEIERHLVLKKKYYYKLMWLNYHLGDKKQSRFYLKKLFKNKLLNLKSFAIVLIFELLPNKWAKKIHLILSKH